MHDNNNIDDQFTDFAWGEMSKVLDKEMPQKKRNRTVFFWLFGLALFASVTFLYFNSGKEQVDMAATSVISNINPVQESSTKLESENSISIRTESTLVENDKNDKKNTNPSSIAKLSLAQNVNSNINKSVKSKNELESPKNEKNSNSNASLGTGAIKSVPKKNDIFNTKTNLETKIIPNAVKETTEKEVKISPITEVKEIAAVQEANIEEGENNGGENIISNSAQKTKETKEETLALIEDQEIEKSEDEIASNSQLPTAKEETIIEETTTSNDPEGSEDEEQKTLNKKQASKWSLGINSIVYLNKDINYINDWTSYVFVKRDFNKKFGVSLGLGYTNFLFNNNKIVNERTSSANTPELDDLTTEVDPTAMDPSTGGNLAEQEKTDKKISFRKHFVTIPLAAHYKFNSKLSSEIGLGCEILLNPTEEEVFKKLNPYFYSGFNFHINKKLNVGLFYKLIGDRKTPTKKSVSFDMNDPQGDNSDLDFVNYNHLFGLKLGYTF